VVDDDRLAVALGYDPDRSGAPVVVAKGERLVAVLIGTVAREAGVPVVGNATLAQSLRGVGESDEIAELTFEAVAQLLALPLENPPILRPNTVR
jgi:flagellar biosynthetic protein FlhB